MSSICLRPTRGSSRILRRTLATSARLTDQHSRIDLSNERESEPSFSSSSSSQAEVKNSKTFEFLYGPETNWRKPKLPSKPATPPKKRAKVDPEAYKNLPPLEVTPRERLVEFSLAEGQSNDRRSYFANDIENELGQEDWSSAEIVENQVGLENGRVVECRRSGHTTIGLILASISLSGKQRLLLLRSSGEIWPISTHDVQFVMPSSLISPSLASKCWSIELLESLSQTESKSGLAEENSIQPSIEMLSARRKVAMVLRKVHRETEKMCGRLTSGSTGHTGGKDGKSFGGVESVWNHFAPEENQVERTSITATQAAEFILNPQSTSDQSQPRKIEIKPNTLPAYAAHTLLMRRPDLFTADQGDMWQSGTFIVRSRSERNLFENVQKGLDGSINSPSGDEALSTFIAKAKKVIDQSQRLKEETTAQELKEIQHKLPDWTDKDKEYISILLAPLIETRSTQTPPSLPLALTIARLISPNSSEIIDRGTIARMLSEMGTILPWDSLELSKITESENRSMVMSSIPTTISGDAKGEHELLKGNELDHLREDFTSHKVFVIDDPTASELDDGISLERINGSDDSVWVHVHIADPTRFITPNHPLAKQASVRGSSTYLVEGNKPLFPLDVIMKELSLGAEVEDGITGGAQGTMTFSAKLNKNGQVDETKVRMGWIKKPRVVTYQAVDKALGLATAQSTRPFGGQISSSQSEVKGKKMDIDSSDLEDLKLLYDIAKAHRARRYATAGFEWTLPSASVNILNRPSSTPSNLFDSSSLSSSPRLFSGSLELDYKVSSGQAVGMNSAGLVAEYMIIAGKLSAEFCHSRDIPVIYRGSFAPKPLNNDVGTLEELLNSRIEGTGQIDPFRMMQPGWFRPMGYVDTKPLEHWIMGFDKKSNDDITGYIRSTSPLRRFDDFLVHWQIKSYLSKQSDSTSSVIKGLSGEEVLGLIKRSDEGFKRAKRAGLNSNKFWQSKVLQRYFNDHDTPLPAQGGHGGGERIDSKNDILIGKISGLTESAPSINGELTPIIINSLGLQCTLNHQAKKTEFKVGEEVKCRVLDIRDWPNPIVNVQLVD